MKTLLLLRHGKAVGSDPAGDHARALNGRGTQASEEAGRLLHRLGLDPSIALVSDSRRTRETAEGVARTLGTPFTIRSEPRLYEASPQTILSLISEVANDMSVVLIVGHNPGIGELARRLTGSGEPQALVGLQAGFPTAALAVIEFAVTRWGDAAPGAGTLIRYIVPDRDAVGG